MNLKNVFLFLLMVGFPFAATYIAYHHAKRLAEAEVKAKIAKSLDDPDYDTRKSRAGRASHSMREGLGKTIRLEKGEDIDPDVLAFEIKYRLWRWQQDKTKLL